MKKVIGIMVMVVFMMATVSSQAAVVSWTDIDEEILSEEILTEEILTEDIIKEETLTEDKSEVRKEPNYIIELGGESFIKIKVNKHFGWVETLIEATDATLNWCGETATNVGETVSSTATTVFETVSDWFSWIGK